MNGKKERRFGDLEVQQFGLFVHGVLFGLHMLGTAYNLKKHNHFDVVMHMCAAAYDLHAVDRHVRSVSQIVQAARDQSNIKIVMAV